MKKVFILSIMCLVLLSGCTKETKKSEKTPEEIEEMIKISQELQKYYGDSLEKIGGEYYENYYYYGIVNDLDDPDNFLDKMANLGIKISLETIYSNKDKINEGTKETLEILHNQCYDPDTVVYIYPAKPYSNKNYNVTINNINCNS